jgi:hypothetical protein
VELPLRFVPQKKEDVMRVYARWLSVGFLAALLLSPVWTDAAAQTTWEIGLKAGMSGARLTGNDVKSFTLYIDESTYVQGDVEDMKMGFVGGGYVTAHFARQFGLRLEALYIQKGGKGDLAGELAGFPFQVGMTFKLDYIELPLLAVVSFPAGASGTFDIFAGPAVAFNLSAELEVEAQGQSASEDIEDASSTDFGGVVGAGFTLALTSVDIFADARWEWGFTNIIDSDLDADIKNSAFGFMVGVGFPLGGKTAAAPAP